MAKQLRLERDMTPKEFTKARQRLGLTQAEMAAFLDCTERSIRRYSTGEAVVPVAVVLLLGLMERHHYFAVL
jgi:DNA-binding transcriptional regulator YiaG